MIPQQILQRLQIVGQFSSQSRGSHGSHQITVEPLIDEADEDREGQPAQISAQQSSSLSRDSPQAVASQPTSAINRSLHPLQRGNTVQNLSRAANLQQSEELRGTRGIFRTLSSFQRMERQGSLNQSSGSFLTVPEQGPRRQPLSSLLSLEDQDKDEVTSEKAGGQNFFSAVIANFIEKLVANGLIETKSANGMMVLKQLIRHKVKLTSAANEDKGLELEIEQKLETSLPLLSYIKKAVQKENTCTWAKQDWAFILLCLNLWEALYKVQGNQQRRRINSHLTPARLKIYKAIPADLFKPVEQCLRTLEQDVCFFIRAAPRILSGERDPDKATYSTASELLDYDAGERRPLTQDQKLSKLRERMAHAKQSAAQDCSYL